jgi:hypothetical protein
MFFIILAIIIVAAVLAALAVRAIGGNIALVDDWRKAWRWYSTYAILFGAFLPEFFNEFVHAGIFDGTPVEGEFRYIAKFVAGAALLLRMVKQSPKQDLPRFGDAGIED